MTRPHIPENIRRAVYRRANNVCEYYRIAEAYVEIPHQVDHIISLKHSGPSTLENLALACRQYNIAKGTDIAGHDLENPNTSNRIPLFNPREQALREHFAMRDDGGIVGQTAIRRVTVRVLNMNHPERVRLRRTLIENGEW